jgi:hypothetical protein
MTTFVNDPAQGQMNADLGVAMADSATSQEWKDASDAAFLWVAQRTRYFTTDEVWRRLAEFYTGPQPNDERAMGGATRRARRDRVMVDVDVKGKPSVRPICHRNRKDVYRSLVVATGDVWEAELVGWVPLHDYSDCVGR